MSVMIRLARHGSKKKPIYSVVAIDKKRKREGIFLDRFGQYNPKAEDPKDKIKVDVEKINAWRSKGAEVSQTVGQLLKTLGK